MRSRRPTLRTRTARRRAGRNLWEHIPGYARLTRCATLSSALPPFRGTWTLNADGIVTQHMQQGDPASGDWSDWFKGTYVRRAAKLKPHHILKRRAHLPQPSHLEYPSPDHHGIGHPRNDLGPEGPPALIEK